MKQKIQKYLKSIFIKFVLAFIIVGLFPIIGMVYIIFDKLPTEIEKFMIANYKEILLYTGKSLKLKIDEFDTLTKSIYNLDTTSYITLEMLQYNTYENLSFDQKKFIEQFIKNILYSDKYIESVFLLDENNKVIDYYSKSTNFYYNEIEFDNIVKFDSINKNKRKLTILPSHYEEYFNKKNKEVLTFARNYLDITLLPETEKVVSVLLIDINNNFIKDITKRLEINDEGQVIILDKEGYLIYNSKGLNENSYIDIIDSNLYKDALVSNSGYVFNNSEIIFYQRVEDIDWLLFYKINKNNIIEIINDLSTVATILMIVIIIIFVFFAIIFSEKLSKPIRNIINQMKKVAYGDLTTKVEINASYEVVQLADAFNKMTEKLNVYIKQVYLAKIKQREMELDAIKAQIRPHYLYNTLEIIRMSALEEKAENTEEMIVSLSNQLKYVIGNSKERIEFGMEIDMIHHYFNIINIRFENRISLEVDVPKEFYKYKMPKLIIQPLVENAVIHGLKVKKGKGKVKLSAKLEGEILKIQVIDDGVGMNEEKVKKINKLLESVDDEDNNENYTISQNSIGLKNVHDRIQMTYGKQYGLSICSKEYYGTLITITIPAEKGVSQ